MPVENGPLAQLAEQVTFNHLVRGSNPLRPTLYTGKEMSSTLLWRYLFYFAKLVLLIVCLVQCFQCVLETFEATGI